MPPLVKNVIEDGSIQTISMGSRDIMAYDPNELYEDGTPQIGLQTGEFNSDEYGPITNAVRRHSSAIEDLEQRVKVLEEKIL